jgi:hypothetical protein
MWLQNSMEACHTSALRGNDGSFVIIAEYARNLLELGRGNEAIRRSWDGKGKATPSAAHGGLE